MAKNILVIIANLLKKLWGSPNPQRPLSQGRSFHFQGFQKK